MIPIIELPYFIGKYQLTRLIGYGASSFVYEAIHSINQKKYACKVVSRDFLKEKDTLFHFEQELRVHSMMDHPNICKIFDTIYQEDKIIILMDFCSKGDLFHWISKLSYQENLSVLSQLISAVQYLHNRGFTHQDLKPENIMLDENLNVKLTDFGNCSEVGKNDPFSFFGTVQYTPPELLKGEPFSKKKVDIWQIGIIAYELFTGSLPWLENYNLEVQICEGIKSIPSFLPDLIAELIVDCTNLNPLKRISISDLAQIKFGLI